MAHHPESLNRTRQAQVSRWPAALTFTALLLYVATAPASAAVHKIQPATVDGDEPFERIANSLRPGDELILAPGVYSQNGRRAVSVKGTAEKPIVIRAAGDQMPVLTRPHDNIDRHNNIEFVNCEHLIVRGLHFTGGSSGVRFIRGNQITFENCEISQTGNNALTMNSGDCDSFVIRANHIHHTGLSTSGPTEGEGMYIGCHSGSCRTTDSLFEGNYIHHTRSTSNGGNDGIEIKVGSYGNIVRDNVIHDTNIGRQYPGVFVYGGGPQLNIVEGNVISRAGEGIQVVSDAVIRNNIIFDCSVNGITAAPHGAVKQMRNVTIVNNTIINNPCGVRIRWSAAADMTFANNAIYCPASIAVDAAGVDRARLLANYVTGRLNGVRIDDTAFFPGGDIEQAFVNPSENDYRPRPGSPLIGAADRSLAPATDFTCRPRIAPFDAGACELESRPCTVTKAKKNCPVHCPPD